MDRSFSVKKQIIIENGVWRLEIQFTAYTLLPRIGCRLDATIHLITSFGIFVQYENYVRIIIPQYLLANEWVFEKQFSTQVYRSCRDRNACLVVKDKILVEIVDTRFERDDFSCVAKFLQKLS